MTSINYKDFYQDFVSKPKSMLIAPAGYGKTHSIVECLKYTDGKQLILTHTHAGVASIKEKIKKAKIESSKYNVETISSFAQKYVLSFFVGAIPKQENTSVYYPFILENAIKLVQITPIKNIIQNTYSGLFVDEYQDCNLKHHQLILQLSEFLPTHILGDYLQGIFDFTGEPLVDMRNRNEMGDFIDNQYELQEPWRWKIGNNEKLGESLKTLRSMLLSNKPIDLELFKKNIEVRQVKDYSDKDFSTLYRNPDEKVFKNMIWGLSNEESLLVIFPESHSTHYREAFVKNFGVQYNLIESIDDKDFYKEATFFDKTNIENIEANLFNFIERYLKNTSNWFENNKPKNKRLLEDKLKIEPIKQNIEKLKQDFSYSLIAKILLDIYHLPNVKCYRKDLFKSICKSLDDAEYNQITVYDAMVGRRNIIRRMGRKVYGKCLGTTLLTKGLEFDTVVIMNIQKFICPKNLYVALTRASKRLIIFSSVLTLTPYK